METARGSRISLKFSETSRDMSVVVFGECCVDELVTRASRDPNIYRSRATEIVEHGVVAVMPAATGVCTSLCWN